MVNETNIDVIKKNKALFLVLILELIAIICLIVAILIICHYEASINDGGIGTTTVEHKSCNAKEYKVFDDRVFYLNSEDVNEHLLSVFSDSLTTNYADSDIKVLIESTPMGPDGLAIIRGYQIVDNVVLEDTFFAIDVDESDYLSAFPVFINPSRIELDGLMKEHEAEEIAYSAIKAKQSNEEVKGTCSYDLFFTDSGNGVIDKPVSSFYYKYIFNFSDNKDYPKGFVFIDGKTGEILESFIDDGIRT